MNVLAAVYNPIAYDGRVQRAAEALSASCDVTVISPAGPALPGPTRFTTRSIELSGNGFVRDYVRFCLAVVQAARRQRPDIIHAHDYFMALPGLVASRLTGARLIYDAHELIIPEPGHRRKLILRAFAVMERLALPRADLVVAANVERAERMTEYYGLATPPLVIQNIPPAPDPAVVLEAATVQVERHSPEDFLLVYQGHLKLERGLSRVLSALAFLPAHFRLLVVGGGPDQDRIEDEIASRRLTGRVEYLGRVPRLALPGIMTECDAGILSYSYASLNDLYCAPNKVFEYAQAGLPILATDQRPLRRIMAAYPIGRMFGEFDGPDEIAEVIRSMASIPKVEYGSAIEEFLCDHPWESEAERLRSAVRALGAGAVP